MREIPRVHCFHGRALGRLQDQGVVDLSAANARVRGVAEDPIHVVKVERDGVNTFAAWSTFASTSTVRRARIAAEHDAERRAIDAHPQVTGGVERRSAGAAPCGGTMMPPARVWDEWRDGRVD